MRQSNNNNNNNTLKTVSTAKQQNWIKRHSKIWLKNQQNLDNKNML